MHKTAILVDGAFYRKRAFNLFGDVSPAKRAKELSSYCHRHMHLKNQRKKRPKLVLTIIQ